MKAHVISGSPTTFNMLVYPEQHHSTQTFIQQHIANISQQLGGVVSDFAAGFIERAKTLYQEANNSAVIQNAKAALRSMGSFFHPNMIVAINDLEGLQAAQPVMQRYLMANPVVREHYFDQRIDGYADSYKNNAGKVKGVDHYDYRRVVDGMVFTPEEYANINGQKYDPEADNPGWICITSSDDSVGDDRPLALHEQFDILDTWELQNAFLKANIDPTNPFGGDVGG